MLDGKKFNQEGGADSTNIQGQTVNINGLQYNDVKEIAKDLWNSNFIELKAAALEIANERATRLTEDFLEKLNDKNPDALNNFNDPGLQNSLFNAQKEYALSGEEELSNLLINIMVERSNMKGRSMRQILLDDAIKIAGKLTPEQMDILSFSFIITSTLRNFTDVKQFADYFCNNLMTYAAKFRDISQSDIRYLDYLGCGSIRTESFDEISLILRSQYPVFFMNGFTDDQLRPMLQKYPLIQMNLINNPHNDNRKQFNNISAENIRKSYEDKLPAQSIDEIVNSYNGNIMSQEDIITYLTKIFPQFPDYENFWQETTLNRFFISPLGIALAIFNLKSTSNEIYNLETWITK